MLLFWVIGITLFVFTFLALAARGGSSVEGKTPPQDPPSKSAPPEDHLVTTKHSAVISGQSLDYTTVAGTMAVTTKGGVCEIFFTAYTLEGEWEAADRPLTFVFNGGPGSSSEWMHMGFLGPRRIACDENGQVTQFPVPIEDNEYSILDLTDLVYYMQGGRERLVYKLESMVGNVNGLDYISPAFSFVDLGQVREESWLMLIQTLKELKTYDHVILDLSEMVHGLLNVLRECDSIYTISDREGLALSRMEQYEELLKSLDYEDLLERSKRCELPRFRKIPSSLEELPYSDLAMYVRKLLEEER